MQQKGLAVALVVIILIAIGFIVRQSVPPTFTFTQTLVDTQANKVFAIERVAGRHMSFPTESPYSEGRNAYPAYQCETDGTIFGFVYPEDPDAPEEAFMEQCPTCGGIDILIPEIPQGQDSMDVPGPIPVVRH